MRRALESPRTRGIITAYTVNRLGTWVGYVALSVGVYDKTHSAIAVAALLVSAQIVPALAVPAVVARVEASARRSELSNLYFFEGVTTIALAVLLSHIWLPAMLLLVALDGTAALAANALLRAALAHSARESASEVQPGQVSVESADETSASAGSAERDANAALNVGFSLTFMAGPAIGGLLVAASSAPLALVLDAMSFFVCGAMLVRIRPHIADAAGDSVRARLRAAFQHINAAHGLRGLLLIEAIAVVFFASGAPIEVAYAKTTLNSGNWGYGVLLGVWGVGTIAGSMIFARSSVGKLRVMLATGAAAVGLAYVGFAVAPSLPLAFVAALVGGCGNGVQWASLISSVQRLTPHELQGRVMGAVEALSAVCPAIGLALGGVLVAVGSPRSAFLVVGIGATATTIGFLMLFRSGLSLRTPAEADPASASGIAPAPASVSKLRRTERRLSSQASDRDPASHQT